MRPRGVVLRRGGIVTENVVGRVVFYSCVTAGNGNGNTTNFLRGFYEKGTLPRTHSHETHIFITTKLLNRKNSIQSRPRIIFIVLSLVKSSRPVCAQVLNQPVVDVSRDSRVSALIHVQGCDRNATHADRQARPGPVRRTMIIILAVIGP